MLEGSHDYNHHYMSLFNSDGKSNDISSLPNATQMGCDATGRLKAHRGLHEQP